MTRGLSAAERNAAAASHRQIVPLVELLFDSITLRFCLGPWDIAVNGETYIHTGALASVRALGESADSMEGMEFVMTGLDPAIIDIATQEPHRGRIVRLLKAFINPDTNAVIGTPKAHFIGRIQSMPITEQNDSCTVSIMAEHYELELSRPSPLRFNNADQQRLYPGDRGCEYAEDLTERTIVWPSRETLQARAR